MRQIFDFLFKLRYIKQEKLKVSFRDMIEIRRTYGAFKIKRWYDYKTYYIMVIDYAIDNVMNIPRSANRVAFEILDEKLIIENG